MFLIKKISRNYLLSTKKQCDGISIFPKIPSLIKLYNKGWKSNSILNLAENVMKHKDNELLENYSRRTVKDIHTAHPKASRAIFNSDLSVMPMRDAKDPKPYISNTNSLSESNYEIIPDPVNTSFVLNQKNIKKLSIEHKKNNAMEYQYSLKYHL